MPTLAVAASFDGTLNTAGDAVDNAVDVGAGSDRYLLAHISWHDSGGHVIDGMTYNGISLDEEGAFGEQGVHRAHLFGLAAPASGSNTLSVNPSAGSSNQGCVITALGYTGVDQTMPADGYAEAHSLDAAAPFETAVTVVSETGDLVVVFHAQRLLTSATGAPTNYTEQIENVNGSLCVSAGDAAGAASVATTCTWTGTGTSIQGIAIGVNLNAAAGGQTVAVGQVTETDTAQALARVKTRTAGQVLETDLSQAMGRRKTAAVGQVSELDVSQPIGRLKIHGVGQVTEVDLAQSITRGGLVVTVNQVTELDTAQPIAWAPKHRLVGQVVEVDLAQPLGRVKVRVIGQTVEVETAQGVSRLKTRTVGQVLETDLALAITTAGGFDGLLRLLAFALADGPRLSGVDMATGPRLSAVDLQLGPRLTDITLED